LGVRSIRRKLVERFTWISNICACVYYYITMQTESKCIYGAFKI